MDVALALDPASLAIDLALDVGGDHAIDAKGDLATDAELAAAVIVSLFTDARALPDDILPDGSGDRRGWWGDTRPPVSGDAIGSRLWLLAREKQLSSVLARAKTYAEEALAWLIEDGVAAKVQVETSWLKDRSGWLAIAVSVERPDKTMVRFEHLWRTV